MCTQGQCMNYMGNWVQFRTPWGSHRGIISEVNNRGVLVRVPRRYAPVSLAYHALENESDEKKLDVALAGIGYGGYPGAYGGRYGGRWGYPGAGAWYGGWWWWWLAFAWIFWLAFLW
jgi:hypothetical protein